MVEQLQQFDDFKYDLNTVQCYLKKDLTHQCKSWPKVCMHTADLYIFALLTAMVYATRFLWLSFSQSWIESKDAGEWGRGKREQNEITCFKVRRIVPAALDSHSGPHPQALQILKCRDYQHTWMGRQQWMWLQKWRHINPIEVQIK